MVCYRVCFIAGCPFRVRVILSVHYLKCRHDTMNNQIIRISTNKLENWYRTSGTTFIVYIRGLHVSTYTQVIFRPSCTCESIKSYARWDPIALTSLKHINYIKCLSIEVKIRVALFTLRWCRIRYDDLSCMDAL